MIWKEVWKDIGVGALSMGVTAAYLGLMVVGLIGNHWWGWVMLAPLALAMLGTMGGAIRG